jgi:hypothetical protein
MNPVNIGDINRINQPDGAIKKARPKAAAACGMDNKGDTKCCIVLKILLRDQPATKSATMLRAIIVVTIAVEKLNQMDCKIPGFAIKALNGSRENVSPPKAGKNPKAGNKVPNRPHKIGAIKIKRASAGANLKISLAPFIHH